MNDVSIDRTTTAANERCVHMVCKYTPIELFAGFGAECRVLEDMAHDFDASHTITHANLCGFGKAAIQGALEGDVDELVLVNCCDVMRRSYEVIADTQSCSFLHLMDLPHSCGPCQVEALARQLKNLKDRYQRTSGITFDLAACLAAFATPEHENGPYVALLGARVSSELHQMVQERFSIPVRNLTCTGLRNVQVEDDMLATTDEDAFFQAYAKALLAQVPCRRMVDPTGRRALFQDPNLKGVVYHTMKFCDFYEPEYAEAKAACAAPILKIETDYTRQSAGQLVTRIEAFAETLRLSSNSATETAAPVTSKSNAPHYAAGIDSGSTSTDVVVLDRAGNIAAWAIIPTGGGARKSADACLDQALEQAGIARSDLGATITTGYGRAYIGEGSNNSITEISCHAKGARYLDPQVRTIIDIGGQDNKVIKIDASGNVADFAMNDKCAAGTGRFLEMMASALQIPLSEMSTMGLTWDEDITISSMCSVFAESEVVSLVAQSKSVPDIVHGLDDSVASKVVGLAKRVGGEPPYMMTGGVAQNAGVVAALERKLGCNVAVHEHAQLCGALGAALFALEQIS